MSFLNSPYTASSLNGSIELTDGQIIISDGNIINVNNLSLENLEIKNLVVDETLNVPLANVKTLRVDNAFIINGLINTIESSNANIDNLNLLLGNIQTLTSMNVYVENANIEILKNTNGNITNLSSQNANMKYSNIENGNIQNMISLNANIENSNMKNIHMTNANISNANIEILKNTNGNITNLSSQNANMKNSNIENGNVQNINNENFVSVNANIENSNMSNVNIRNANIEILKNDNGDILNLFSQNANIENIISINGNIQTLNTEIMISVNANIENADILNLNSNNGNIQTLTSNNGFVGNIEGNFLNYETATIGNLEISGNILIDYFETKDINTDNITTTNSINTNITTKKLFVENMVVYQESVTNLNVNKFKCIDSFIKQSNLMPTGTMIHNFSPKFCSYPTWILCDGRWLKVSEFTNLFLVIGDTFGYRETKGYPEFKLFEGEGLFLRSFTNKSTYFNGSNSNNKKPTDGPQMDDMRSHTHNTTMFYDESFRSVASGGTVGVSVVDNVRNNTNGSLTQTRTSTNYTDNRGQIGGNETHPMYLGAFLYIKS
jgi:microcystin-dependent protein